MQIFLSYASEKRALAEPLALALRDRGHQVFLDKDDLPPGKSYGAQIEEGISLSDLLIFLISPESVQQGRYTLSELEFARKRWRRADRRVLPVMIEPTDMMLVPAFAKSVTILEPKGNAAAEVAVAVDELRGREYTIKVGLLVSAIALAIGLLSYFSFQTSGEARFAPVLPVIGRMPAPEVGVIFGLPIAFAVWQWGVRRWWAPLIPLLFVAICYWVSVPYISKYTIQLERQKNEEPTRKRFEAVIQKIAGQLSADDNAFLLGNIEKVIEFNTTITRVGVALVIGLGMALATMLSLGIIMPQFFSLYRWLIVLVAGAAVSAIDTVIVLGGNGQFSGNKATLLILVWQVVFGALVGYWLARGRTTVSA